MAFDLILFDCDGTLVDSQNMILKTLTRAFEVCGLTPPAPAALRSIIGLSLPEAMTRLTDGRENAPIAELAAAYRREFVALAPDIRQTAPLFAGARETLETLLATNDTQLGIVTGKGRRGLAEVLAVHGLAECFCVLRTGDDGPSKPHPFMVLDAIAAVGGDAGRTVVVGDTSYDIEMGRAAGALTLGVAWGYHPRAALDASGAHAVAESFADVPSLIAELLARGR